jgi:hypothetical protein
MTPTHKRIGGRRTQGGVEYQGLTELPATAGRHSRVAIRLAISEQQDAGPGSDQDGTETRDIVEVPVVNRQRATPSS